MAGIIIGRPQKTPDILYSTAVQRKTMSILDLDTHPFHSEFELLPLGQRYRAHMTRKNIYTQDSFIPNAISLVNKPRKAR